MQAHWLSQKNSSSCILFFAGWGMDPTPFTVAATGRHDLLMVYDYRQSDLADLPDLTAEYQDLHLVAWSMGVWVAARLFEKRRELFTSATALNGTLNPVDDRCGIPVKTFDDMIGSFSNVALEMFYTNMFDELGEAKLFLQNRPQRPPDEMRQELAVLRDAACSYPPGRDMYANKIVGSRDRIFPARSQIRSWGKENCTIRRIPHFPFYGNFCWDDLI